MLLTGCPQPRITHDCPGFELPISTVQRTTNHTPLSRFQLDMISSSFKHYLDVLAAIAVIYLLLRLYKKPRAQLQPPPGPRSWPILGNLFDLPSSKEWVTFSDWAKKWGKCMWLWHPAAVSDTDTLSQAIFAQPKSSGSVSSL